MANPKVVFYEIWEISEKQGPYKLVGTYKMDLPRAIEKADYKMKIYSWYGVGVCVAGTKRQGWSYLNSAKCGPEVPENVRPKRLPKWLKAPLPMGDNPLLEKE